MKKLLMFIPLSFLVGCVSSGGYKGGINAQVEARANIKIAEYIEMDRVERQTINNTNVSEGEWVNTQKPNCKVFVGGSSVSNIKVYWDGQCKNGYAYGLGREFGIINGDFIEVIAEYTKPQERSKEYYFASQNQKKMLLGALHKKEENDSTLVYAGEVNMNDIFFEGLFFNDNKNHEMLKILQSKEFNYIERTYMSKGGLSILSIQDLDDPLYQSRYKIAFRGQIIGMLDKYNDGGYDFYYQDNNKLVMIDSPSSIMELLDQKMSLIDNAKNDENIKKNKELAEAKVKQYIASTCGSRVNKVKGLTDAQYFTICEKYKSLNTFSNQINNKFQVNMQNKKQNLDYSINKIAELKNAETYGASTGNKVSAWEEGFKLAVLVLSAVADGLNQQPYNQNTITAYTPQPQVPITFNNSVRTNNQGSQSYKSSYGNNYKYDLNNQSDRLRYSIDTEAQINDKIRVNPTAIMEQRKGEYGGGYLD